MAYEEFKSSSSRTNSTKVLGDKAFNIVQKLQSMVESKVVFFQWFTNFFIRKSATHTGSRIVYEKATKTSKNKQKKKQQQHKVIIKKIKKRKVYLCFEENICWAA